MLAKARHHIADPKDLLSLYRSLFSSIQTFGAQIWGLINNYKLKKIERAKKKLLLGSSHFQIIIHTLHLFSKRKKYWGFKSIFSFSTFFLFTILKTKISQTALTTSSLIMRRTGFIQELNHKQLQNLRLHLNTNKLNMDVNLSLTQVWRFGTDLPNNFFLILIWPSCLEKN